MKKFILVLFLVGCGDNDRSCVQIAMKGFENHPETKMTWEQAAITCGIKKEEGKK